MALVTVPDIKTGNQITSTDINSFGSSLTATSTNLNDDNVRDQGIDRRNLASDSVTKTNTSQSMSSRSENHHQIPLSLAIIPHPSTANTWIAVGMNGVALGDNPITIAPNETVIVYCSFEYEVNINSTHLQVRDNTAVGTTDGAYEVNFAIYNSINGGAFAAVPGTIRYENLVLLGTNISPNFWGRHFLVRGSMSIVTAYKNTTASDIEYRAALYGNAQRSLDAAKSVDADITEFQMFAKIVRR